MNTLQFIIDHRTEILAQTVEHIGLTAAACAIAICIGVPLGIFLTRRERASTSVLGVAGVIQTIPSVALLGFLLPLFGIGVAPAIVALFLYALLPIIRNTYTGINEVDPAVKEAARGMGMSDIQILTRVELPLAIPVIFAGIRTATVINVGVATLCALIGAGGLGKFIFRGIALYNVNMILAGAFPAAILALTFDFVLSVIQKFIRQIIKPLLVMTALLLPVGLYLFLSPMIGGDTFRAGFTAEFMQRPDGYPGFKNHYGLSIDTVELDPGLMYQALRSGKVDVICGFSTDGRIKAYHLKVLKDDKNYFPPYYAAPLINGQTLRKYPQLKDILSRLEGHITNKQMTEMNYRADEGKESPVDVARSFLKASGFETSKNNRGNSDIIIGSKNFTEQYILAHLFAIIIENYSDLNTEVKTGLAGTKICFDALVHGDIDIYPEYTGTGLLVLLDTKPAIRDKLIGHPNALYRYVKTKMKKQSDLDWLSPLGFNNTYAIMMRKKDADKLKLKTISDLKSHLMKDDQI